jgi:hypothetical protein
MVAVGILLFIIILSILCQNEESQTCPAEEEVDEDIMWLRNYLFECNKYKYERLYPDRETSLWNDYIKRSKLSKIRKYILNELSELPRTDWEWYVLNAIHRKSPALKYYLVDGHLDLALLKKNEENGIKDAFKAVKHTRMEDAGTLRKYFHLVFENILYSCRSDNLFYLRGQWKVARALRSYVASMGSFMPSVKEIFTYDNSGTEDNQDDRKVPQPDIFGRLASYYDMLEEWRKKHWFDINSDNPVIEFNLEEISNARTFVHEGSLLNCLYLELQDLLVKLTHNQFPEHRSVLDKCFDAHCVSYAYNLGTIRLVKYTGTVEYFPHRLYIEFDTIAPNDPIIQKLRTYKIHLEGND